MTDLEVARRADQRQASLEELRFRRILRRRDVEAATGLSRSAIYKQILEGTFPKPVPLSPRAVGWASWEVAAWILGRVADRDAKSAA